MGYGCVLNFLVIVEQEIAHQLSRQPNSHFIPSFLHSHTYYQQSSSSDENQAPRDVVAEISNCIALTSSFYIHAFVTANIIPTLLSECIISPALIESLLSLKLQPTYHHVDGVEIRFGYSPLLNYEYRPISKFRAHSTKVLARKNITPSFEDVDLLHADIIPYSDESVAFF